MKQKLIKTYGQSGFTLIELMVVISMIVIISTVVVIDFNRQRLQRSMTIAKNEMVTNLRKVQSYMLSSKNLPSGEAVRYYIVSVEEAGTSYSVHAIDNEYIYHDSVETIQLPAGISIANNTIVDPGGGDPIAHKCLQIIFSAPYGKMYARGGSSCSTDIVQIVQDPVQLVQLNEQEASINFEDGTDNPIVHSVILTPTTGLITPQQYDPTEDK